MSINEDNDQPKDPHKDPHHPLYGYNLPNVNPNNIRTGNSLTTGPIYKPLQKTRNFKWQTHCFWQPG